MELAKQYDPKEAQARWTPYWMAGNFGHGVPTAGKEAFSIVIPPPNVTGALHMGHALNNTLQDILVRFHRMNGKVAEWMPGTDHAGIATQSVVEKLIFAQEKKTRRDLGREELVSRIWQWKDRYETRILGQLRDLGASADWSRTRFTLDPVCARAVRETFFRMFRDGYIFRGKRLVNWDTHLQTSVADDETYVENIKGGFWTFKYPVDGMTDTFIRFSTTRPETMLGDTAVCVHPSDERYKALIGKTVTIPLVGRSIPIIADGLLADPEKGTGCVKVTPAHDPNDYACGQRNNLAIINILNPDGTINAEGGKFAGLDRMKAREAVTAEMEALGFFEGREDREIPLAFSDRSKTSIEPYLSDQWFVRMGDREDGRPSLAESAMEVVRDGSIRFTPERYARTYLEWLGEKRDWCISRQLWWGHRIPVWYAPTDVTTVAKAFAGREDVSWVAEPHNNRVLICSTTDLPEMLPGTTISITQDDDVLDTWFSSALWPFSTFGWPEKTPELDFFYPTSVLVTSRDIITLWVARMVIMGRYNLGKIPFRDVYVHTKMLDGFGETMSKSRGNGVDPLDIIELYGADALRFGIAMLATETQDSRLPVSNICPHCGELVPVKQEHMYMRTKKLACPKCKGTFRPGGPWPAEDPEMKTAKQASDRFEIGRNFSNKLWNAARFLLMNLEGYTPGPVNPTTLPIEDRWILSRLATTVRTVEANFNAFAFSEAARTLYDFTWSDFCDWYIEMSKGRLKETDRTLVQRVLVHVLDRIIRLIHPMMPFVTESLFEALNEVAPVRGLPMPVKVSGPAIIAEWPKEVLPSDSDVETRIGLMQELVRGIREIRNRYMVEPRTPVTVRVRCNDETAADFLALKPFIESLAGVGSFAASPTEPKPPQSATQLHAKYEAYVSLEGLIDPAAEIKRLEKQKADKAKQLEALVKKLANADFVARAPAEVVAAQRVSVIDLEKQLEVIDVTMKDLQQ